MAVVGVLQPAIQTASALRESMADAPDVDREIRRVASARLAVRSVGAVTL
jgi:hypothetical protein